MTVIGTNISSLRAANASMSANSQLSTAMERLSTGKRINSAKDDAAGMAIATSMTSQVKGMNQAIRNSNDGIALAQTADGALSEVTNMGQRIRELAVQSASGTYGQTDRDNIQAEVDELTKQISTVLSNTKFNEVALFTQANGGAGVSLDIQTGANNGEKVALKIGNLDTSALVSGTTRVATADDVAAGALTTQATDAGTAFKATKADRDAGVTVAGQLVDVDKTYTPNKGDLLLAKVGDTIPTGISIKTAATASAALDTVDKFLNNVSNVRAGIGAIQSRLQSAVNTLTNNSTNLSDAKSRIEDADFSAETQALAKAQILSQASTAMLAQANQSQQGVLKLLQ